VTLNQDQPQAQNLTNFTNVHKNWPSHARDVDEG
jgi:hypothetical protein